MASARPTIWAKPGEGVTGLFYGDASQLAAQAIGAVVCMAWSFGCAYAFFKLQNLFMRIRSSREDGTRGLTFPEMGAAAYPDFQVHGAISPSGLRM